MTPRIDPLTGLLAHAELATLRPGSRFAMVDLAAFRSINHSFSHEIGDQVIRTVATRLQASFAPRRVFRVGGDEFGIELEGSLKRSDLSRIATQILTVLAEPIPEIERGIEVRVGFAARPVGEDWMEAWVSAERAQHIAGVDGVSFAFGADTDRRVVRRQPLPFEDSEPNE